jgi:hypothetical protein
LGAEDKKTETREYSSKHQGLGVAQVDASALRIRALQLIDNNLEPMIRHEPNTKECRIGEDQLKPTNLKRQILHVQNGIVYITNQIRRGFIDDPDDYAFKEGMPCPTTHKILAPQGFRKEIITEGHNSKFAGHSWGFKTQERLRQDFWWPHMDKDIKEHIDQCEPCQTTTDKGKPPDGPITGLQITSGPSQRIHADLFGPLQNSERGNMYILVITDAFTKMARLTPLNGKDATTVTKAMMDNMYRFGIPHTVVMDQGLELVSQMQNVLFDSLNIDRKVTTGYHPRCNGAAEQFNKIMISNIKAQLQQQGKSTLDWEQCLAPLMFNYNMSINKSTKITPFHATFNYNPRVPLWSGVEHRFDKHLKNATGKDNSRKPSQAESATPQHKTNRTPQPTTHGRHEGRRKQESTPRS